jgi:hypothetical protein
MNPLLTEALVAPRLDDLRRSARLARRVRTARPVAKPCEKTA